MRKAKISRTTTGNGKREICQLNSAGVLRKTIFDTFRLPYSRLAYLLATTVLTVPMLELVCDWYAVMDGTRIIDNAYVSIEYKPIMARAYTHTRNNKRVGWTGILLSKYVSLRCGIESSLISGLLYCSYSLWVGIRIVIVRRFMGMEHLNYACHP